MNRKLVIGLIVLWFAIQIPAIFYGTQKIPLHISYIGDEQAPINGALKMLQNRSILGMRNAQTVYYGPIFSIIALPAVVLDYSEKFVLGLVNGADDYKNYILWNWGGIVWKARLISCIFSFLTLLILYKIFNTYTFNPSGNKKIPLILTALISTNYLIFEYGHFFRHWVFVIFSISGMLYYIIRVLETGKSKYYAYSILFTVFGFGVSYLSVIFLAAWVPVVISWIYSKNYIQLKKFTVFSIALLALMACIVFWNPHPFFRILGLTTGDAANLDTSRFSTEASEVGFSFSYYIRLLITNIFPIFILIGYFLAKQFRNKIYKDKMFWVILTPLAMFFISFGILAHHESRYMLPTVLMLYVLTAYLALGFSGGIKFGKVDNRIVGLMLAILVITNIFFIFNNIKILVEGPVDVRLIKELQNIPDVGKKKILVYKYYLLGTIHTKEAYLDYMQWSKKTNVNLYKTILESEYPKDVTPLNIYYKQPPIGKNDEKSYDNFDYIVYFYDYKIESGDESDHLDLNPYNMIRHDKMSDRYNFIK